MGYFNNYIGRVLKVSSLEYSSVSKYWVIYGIKQENSNVYLKISPLFRKNVEEYEKLVDLEFLEGENILYSQNQSEIINSDSFLFLNLFRIEDIPFIYGMMLVGMMTIVIVFFIWQKGVASDMLHFAGNLTAIFLVLITVIVIIFKNMRRKKNIREIYGINN